MLTSKQKSDWVAALRSGMYEQGILSLENNGKFCCLGVLAKLNGLPTEGGGLDYKCHQSINLADQSRGSFTTVGVFHTCGMPSIGTFHTLAQANDSGEYSFTQIADHIEQHLPTED